VVLTAATDGITLGAAMASYFGATLAYAKKSKETAVEEFIESRQRLASGIELTYYLPARALSAGQSVLVVDDLVRSGETQELLLDIASQADADVTGVFALIAVGDEGMSRARATTDAPVGALATFEGRRRPRAGRDPPAAACAAAWNRVAGRLSRFEITSSVSGLFWRVLWKRLSRYLSEPVHTHNGVIRVLQPA